MVHSVPAIPRDVGKEMGAYLRGLQELIETKVGSRGNALDRNVTLRELRDAGVVKGLDAAGRYTPNAVNAQNRGFTNTGTLRMYKSPLTPVYESSSHEFKHGLGRVPDIVQGFMHCTEDDETYKAGDIISMNANLNMGGTDSSTNEGTTILADNSKIEVFIGDNGWGFVIERDGTGGHDALGAGDTTLASSKWSIEVKAFVFEESTQGN